MTIKSSKLTLSEIGVISIKVVLIQGELRSVHDLWMHFSLNRTEVVKKNTTTVLKEIETNYTEI